MHPFVLVEAKTIRLDNVIRDKPPDNYNLALCLYQLMDSGECDVMGVTVYVLHNSESS